MDQWPITITEAARRLDIEISTASTIVRACEIPHQVVGRTRCISESSFEQLRRRAAPFMNRDNRRKVAPVS